MAFEQRATKDYFSTSLLSAATVSSSTLQSVDFVGLDTDYGTNGKYLPLVLHDDTLGAYEVVWVTAHTSASNTVTVTRGMEGTTAQAWGAGTRVEAAPTSYDAVLARLASSMPSDSPIGGRVMRGDKKDVAERANGLWAPSVGVAFAADAGPRRSGTIPDGSAVLLRGGHKVGTTTTNGLITVAHQTPFPNATIATALGVVSTGVPAVAVVSSETATGVTIGFYAISGGANVGSGVAVAFQYISMGF
ncbi:hypothetical protein L3Q65_46160 [Amycolatopsis sp. FU40]|uniref:hypothetical protein n=1 Tax=Amycolatopsis sp. FU40 TaxID=2914159 RepID=UPI001F4843E3|nr:hypothetical protein [Amycolatopsis sp. FU40]UKD55160.1 hypothetical protein L3Q65_46160 [Amycolatopsis sp. FU40]